MRDFCITKKAMHRLKICRFFGKRNSTLNFQLMSKEQTNTRLAQENKHIENQLGTTLKSIRLQVF